jgi:hypothetical protein
MKFTTLFISLMTLLMVQHIKAQQNTTPCACCTEQYRQFDFWVGSWETFTGDKLAGTNKIVVLQDSCIIQENWTANGGGYTGTSYNFFNKTTQKWEQIWIDNGGNTLHLEGEFKDGKMTLVGKNKKTNKKGEPYIERITWTPNADGTVRQNWEVSKDDGKNWNSIFNGLYKKKS